MKKRILSVLLCATMVLSMFTACGGGNNGGGQQGGNGDQQGSGETKKITVAAFEGGYGADLWKEVTAAYTAQTGVDYTYAVRAVNGNATSNYYLVGLSILYPNYTK